MGNSIMCCIEDCVYCKDYICCKKIISIEWKGTDRFEKGERVCYPTCTDFKDKNADEE